MTRAGSPMGSPGRSRCTLRALVRSTWCGMTSASPRGPATSGSRRKGGRAARCRRSDASPDNSFAAHGKLPGDGAWTAVRSPMSWPPQLPARYLMWPRPERALVGRGTFGEVWRAKDQQQGVLVALKILRARDARVQTRMEREAALAAKVAHPNVIALYDMGRTPEGLPYLAFPFASDGSLRRLLGAPPPWSELLELFGDLLGALAALHSRGFLHLDVKLDNVLLHRAGARRRNVWLADLGVAVALYGEDRDDRLIGGTIGYMPTEQLAGQHQLWGPPTDLFAFGAVAYRLLCGELPFPEREALEAHGARYRPPATLPVLDGYVVPPGLAEVVLPLLHPSPRGRYDRAA